MRTLHRFACGSDSRMACRIWHSASDSRPKRSKLAICIHKLACRTGLCDTEPHGGSSPCQGQWVAALANEDLDDPEPESRCMMHEEPGNTGPVPRRGTGARTEVFHMRMSVEEKQRLMERAGQWARDHGYAANDSGMMSRYAREMLLEERRGDGKLTYADLIGFKRDLHDSQRSIARVGTLMNQIARVANSTGHIMTNELRETVGLMRHEIDRLEDTIRTVWERNR